MAGADYNNDGVTTPEERAKFAEEQRKKSESSGQKKGTTGKIPWKTNSQGDAILIRKGLDEAKNYMVPGVPEYSWLQSTFKTLKPLMDRKRAINPRITKDDMPPVVTTARKI